MRLWTVTALCSQTAASAVAREVAGGLAAPNAANICPTSTFSHQPVLSWTKYSVYPSILRKESPLFDTCVHEEYAAGEAHADEAAAGEAAAGEAAPDEAATNKVCSIAKLRR